MLAQKQSALSTADILNVSMKNLGQNRLINAHSYRRVKWEGSKTCMDIFIDCWMELIILQFYLKKKKILTKQLYFGNKLTTRKLQWHRIYNDGWHMVVMLILSSHFNLTAVLYNAADHISFILCTLIGSCLIALLLICIKFNSTQLVCITNSLMGLKLPTFIENEWFPLTLSLQIFVTVNDPTSHDLNYQFTDNLKTLMACS